MNLARLREQLVRDEGGYRLKMYRDSLGIETIGLGHNLRDKPISQRAAVVIADDDIASVLQEVETRLPWAITLDDARHGALLNLCFNIGPGFIAKNPKMIAYLRNKRYADAARELLNGPYKEQVGARAFRLARQLETGEWQ